jgi:hypothetical protein
MTDERRASRGTQLTKARQRPAKAPSAGMPGADPGSAAQRLAELEARLARLESTTGLRERGRDLMGRVAPPEAGQHFRNAGREQLLGIRSIVDFWIRRIELSEERAGGPEPTRERIEID